MDCKKAQYLSFLFKEGELTGSQLQKYKIHISTCGECSDLVNELMDFQENLSSLKSKKPVFTKAEELTTEIITFVEKDVNRKNEIHPLNLFDRFIFKLVSPNFRVVMTSLLVLILSLFLTQEYNDLNKLSNLEKRVSAKQIETLEAVSFRNNDLIIDKIESLFNFISGEKTWVEIPQDMILIKKETLFSLMKFSGELNNSQKKIITSYLRTNLGEINWSDGLNEMEIQSILENSAQIRQDVEEFKL